MFLSEDWFEIIKVDCDVASIPPFRIDILPSSESIWFSTKITRIKLDNKIELKEVLGLLYLPLDQYLSSGKILKTFIVHNNIDGIG